MAGSHNPRAAVREEERTMVARDLHDQIGQILTAVEDGCRLVARCLSPQDDAQLF